MIIVLLCYEWLHAGRDKIKSAQTARKGPREAGRFKVCLEEFSGLAGMTCRSEV